MTLSINIPSATQAKETDYCGVISGAKTDKIKNCRFTIFYGKLKTAPLIEECPVNLECKVIHTLTLNSHTLFVCQIEETYISESGLTDNKPDVQKMNPIVFTTEPRQYYSIGNVTAQAYSIGMEIEQKKNK